jgi:hypothetical protein
MPISKSIFRRLEQQQPYRLRFYSAILTVDETVPIVIVASQARAQHH